MVASVACGDHSNLKEAASAMSTLGKTIYPSEKRNFYKEKFDRYKSISEALEKYWD